jgi:hypothetical protein
MVIKYINELEDMKKSGDGMRAIRRHGGTVLMIYGVQRKDFKKIRILLAAEGVFVPDITHLKGCVFFNILQCTTTTRTIENHPAVACLRRRHGF